MSLGLKYHASIVVLLILIFAHTDATILMPLCDVCATSNATNCLTCRTAKIYATIVTGNKYFYPGTPQCISGYYMNQVNPANIFCAPCFAGCTKCTGPLSTNCQTCAYAPMQLCSVCATDDCTNCLTCYTLKQFATVYDGNSYYNPRHCPMYIRLLQKRSRPQQYHLLSLPCRMLKVHWPSCR